MAWDTNVSGRMGAYLPIQQASADNVRSYSKAGANIGKLIGGMVESSQAEKNKALNDAKISALIQKYNDPNDKDFAGMEGAQRALKLSRLLLPYDAEMSKRWEDRSVLMGREMEAGRTDLQKQQITADTELSKKLIEAQNKPEKEVSPTDLYKMALGAFKAGTYPEWRNAQSRKYQMVLPENATKEDIETLVSNSQLAGGTLANKLEQSNIDLVSSKLGITKDQLDIRAKELGLSAQTLASKLATGEIEWRFPSEKQIEKGAVAPLLPAVQEKVDSLIADYRNDIKPHIEMQDAIDKLNATLPESGPIKGFSAVATINAFSKVIDPGAVVRDSDFKIASEATGKIDKVKAIINSYFDGNTISAEGVASLRQFLNSYQNLVNQSMGRFSDFYGQKAESIGGGATRDMISVSPERTTFKLGTPRKK